MGLSALTVGLALLFANEPYATLEEGLRSDPWFVPWLGWLAAASVFVGATSAVRSARRLWAAFSALVGMAVVMQIRLELLEVDALDRHADRSTAFVWLAVATLCVLAAAVVTQLRTRD